MIKVEEGKLRLGGLKVKVRISRIKRSVPKGGKDNEIDF